MIRLLTVAAITAGGLVLGAGAASAEPILGFAVFTQQTGGQTILTGQFNTGFVDTGVTAALPVQLP